MELIVAGLLILGVSTYGNHWKATHQWVCDKKSPIIEKKLVDAGSGFRSIRWYFKLKDGTEIVLTGSDTKSKLKKGHVMCYEDHYQKINPPKK